MKKPSPSTLANLKKTSQGNVGTPKKKRNRLTKNLGANAKRQRKALLGMAAGLPKEAAMVKAGYTPMYANSAGYKYLRRPMIQSMFTDEIQKALEGKGKVFGAMVAPYIEALDAPVIVKSNIEGIACIARDPDTQAVIPDHRVRMEAADKLIALHGGVPREVDMPPPAQPPMNILIVRDQAKVVVQQGGMEQAQAAKVEGVGEATTPGMPTVTIRKG